MNLTPEQEAIIASQGNIAINAVAGSGKTTTLIAYAASRPSSSRILYLAFNKTVKQEAIAKFKKAGLANVAVETAHSLAYRHIVRRGGYQLKQNGYKIHEVVELMGLDPREDKHAEYIAANHILKFMTYFCNSNKPKVKDLDYREVVKKGKSHEFVSAAYDYLESQCRLFLAKMERKEIEITHDFYLKKFQLAAPRLPYDYILFDEGQDASPAMLDVFLRQPATKVMVGDTHQQIYGWRYAINSLDQVGFPCFQLTNSFRFDGHVAELAQAVLKWKELLKPQKPVPIIGKGGQAGGGSKAVLGRSNLGLLKRAIELVIEEKSVKRIHFEGEISSYTYAEDGASLYDVLNLDQRKRKLIRNPVIKRMRDTEELEDYIEKTEDRELATMLELVNSYGTRIPDIINQLKDQHVKAVEREKAEMIFSTVHRAKGMEYDEVEVVNDFISESKLSKLLEDEEVDEPDKLLEEVNLLYVAITRARHVLKIPEPMLPIGYSPKGNIFPIAQEWEGGGDKGTALDFLNDDPAYGKKNRQETGARSYTPWTKEQDGELTAMYCEKQSVAMMAQHFQRSKGAIYRRIKKLDLVNLYD